MRDSATVKRAKLAIEVRMERISTGLLPTLSDQRPSKGEKMNCIMEKDARSTPRLVGPALRRAA